MDSHSMRAEVGQVISMTDKVVRVQYDTELLISEGSNRYETHWKNKKIRWSMLLKKLSESFQTHETHAEYMKMPKDRQDQIKDIGGFVGGHLQGGHRKTGAVAARQIVTLDADFAPADLSGEIRDSFALECAWAIYSTHKHTPEKPRLRLIIPLDREVSAEEYEAIARKIAEKVGIDWFDDSTYQPTRLMYWPSHSADVTPYFDSNDAPILQADTVLAEYRDWSDIAEWPESSRMNGIRKKQADKQGDPLEKKGIVGAFCRTYSVTEAMEKYLPGVYLPTAKGDRYTYAAGSTAAGVVIYEDGKYFYSNHGTDPLGGQLLNAFDLVRLYKFRDLDEGSEKTGQNAPSFRAMAELARDDANVRVTIANDAQEGAREDFQAAADDDWKKLLHVGEKGVSADAWNAELILEHEPELQGIRYNEMDRRIDAQGVPWDRPRGPWRDADDAQLYQWLVRTYGVQFPQEKFTRALIAVTDRRRFHPVREYLDSLQEWDGVPRVETILVDLLGAEDNQYTREATRCCLTAAVARIYEPGVKFDNVLIVQGPQGIGKSYLFGRLGGKWYSDNLSVSDMRDKTGAEKLQGYWILELSELTGMRKVEVEAVKGFIARQEDIYRAAYGRNTERRLRQCVIVGSTNDDTGFLRDVTGNRRFWPVKVTGRSERHPWQLSQDEVDQIWAEAKSFYDTGEGVLLSREAALMATDAQRDAMEQDDRQGIVEEYLERLLPEGWEDMDVDRRLLFLDSGETGTVRRTEVSNMEIWVEALHGSGVRMDPNKDGRAISAMMARIPGWKKTGVSRRIIGYGKQRIYRRTGTVEQLEQ